MGVLTTVNEMKEQINKNHENLKYEIKIIAFQLEK